MTFVINYACYFSEIYRGGIRACQGASRSRSQVLGMTKSQIFFKVTLLQVVKRIVPMGNEVHHPGEGHLPGPGHLCV